MTSRFQRSQVPTCGKAMNDWKLLGSPWGSRSFCSGGTDEYRVGLNKKDSPNGVPMSSMAVAGLCSLQFRDKRLPSQPPNPDAMFFIFFFRAEIGVPLGLKAAMGKLSICFFLFWSKNPKISGGFPVGVRGWFLWRQVDGATPVIFPSSLLTSAPWCRCFCVATPMFVTVSSLRSQPGSGWGDPGKVCGSGFLAKQKRKRSLRNVAKDVCMDVSYYQFLSLESHMLHMSSHC